MWQLFLRYGWRAWLIADGLLLAAIVVGVVRSWRDERRHGARL
jgi:hypothetical protein